MGDGNGDTSYGLCFNLCREVDKTPVASTDLCNARYLGRLGSIYCVPTYYVRFYQL